MPRVKKTYLIWTRSVHGDEGPRVFAWGGRLGEFKVPDDAEAMITLEFNRGAREADMHKLAAQEIAQMLKVEGILFGGTVKWSGGRRRFTITEGK
jgi:hypothetical protein